MGFFSSRRNPSEDDDSSALPPEPVAQRDSPVDDFDPAALPASLDATRQSAATPPLTKERVLEALREDGSHYFVDSDGDIGWPIDGAVFYMFQLGKEDEILQVRGTWSRVASIDHLPRILEFCNTWNIDKFWPKTYTRVRDDGAVQVNVEVSTDFEHGVTNEQLLRTIRMSLGTGIDFFAHLDREFPDPIAPPSKLEN